MELRWYVHLDLCFEALSICFPCTSQWSGWAKRNLKEAAPCDGAAESRASFMKALEVPTSKLPDKKVSKLAHLLDEHSPNT